jgi:hypothetical protein
MSEHLAYVVVMETFLKREGISYRRRNSATSNSIYFRMQGKRHPYTLRVSDHPLHEEKSETGWVRAPDFNIQTYSDLKRVQVAISALLK